ncbi:hypothetical protein HYE59_01155 [Aggregatibacter actinomycetemcomitans]|uniref:hypothetical protein n=1 Tax=Aggregatibacter actinomycetemcomitans TaxID=714 RepID=UPI00197C41AD|nr:hypothetical protein [Aggregatibacter actinomycetemcomitans]MBN6076176.1 hypothetical protein [Aggregatibacter actinomycetemcomitans]
MNSALSQKKTFQNYFRERRHGFVGVLLDEGDNIHQDVIRKYLGKRLPEKYRRRGASNPVKYAYKK